MTDTIEATLMRSGTSRGLYLPATELPAARADRERILLALMGSAASNQVDGVGGTVSVTNKAAIVSRSDDPRADVDYLFAQVDPQAGIVDWGPTCGNVLTGIAPFALERGLVEARDGETSVRIRLVNTGSYVEATVRTPGGRVEYEGDTVIDGVPGAGAPITLAFLDCVGSKTGALLPTDEVSQPIDGVPVTLVDAAMPMMLVRADALGCAGDEPPDALDGDAELMARIEAMRLQAGRKMGFGDVSEMVVPKVALVAAPRSGGTLLSRYFTPWSAHPSHAVTGGVAVAVASQIPGSVAAQVAAPAADGGRVIVEHAAGRLEIALELEAHGAVPRVERAGVVRTARPIFTGQMYVAHARAAKDRAA